MRVALFGMDERVLVFGLGGWYPVWSLPPDHPRDQTGRDQTPRPNTHRDQTPRPNTTTRPSMYNRCKVRACHGADKYEFALKIGDIIHLLVDNELMHVIECPRDNESKIEEIARSIHELVENGCVTTQIVKPLEDCPLEDLFDELMEPTEEELEEELGAFIDSLTNTELEEANMAMCVGA